jgi:thermitase
VELYAMSTRVSELAFRIVAPNVPGEWHAIDDLGWLPAVLQNRIRQVIALLPRVGSVVEQPRPVSLPTDGTVYDAELAHCSSCDSARETAIDIRLRKANAEALRACLETQLLELEIQRRSLLLKRGELAPFEAAGAAVADSP